MDDQRVVSEPAGDSEAALSTGSDSTVKPLSFQTGEFEALVNSRSSVADADSTESLARHMSALVGGEAEPVAEAEVSAEDEADPSQETEKADGPGLLKRVQNVGKLKRR